MNATEFLLVIQAGITAMDKHSDLPKRLLKIEVKWVTHPKGECGEVHLPDIKIEFAPPRQLGCDCDFEEED